MEQVHNHKAKVAIIIIAILAATGVAVVSILRDRIVNQQFRQVTVTGQGRVAYQPDIAILNLGVQIDKATTSEEALNKLNEKITKIVAAVKTENIPDSDITTLNYSLYPQYDYKDNISQVTGYNANQQVTVKIAGYDQDKDHLNRVISAAAKAGVNQVNSLMFDYSKMNDLKQMARLKAISDAREKGIYMASAAGVELKDIAGWYENMMVNPNTYNSYNQGGGGMGGGGYISPQTPVGSQEMVMEVSLTYNLK
ncbi:MAG: SIMPL domain-containing protein [Patescibacteria group bacterium]